TQWKASMESDDNWSSLERLRQKGWDRIQKEFAESQQALTEGLAAREDGFLDSPFGKTSTFEQLVQGIAQHDVYHLGQIGLIKKMTT
ncbi:MAG: DinB family protein, partial [Bacteroidia bacterium]|nr:DinB family protein [Bacteroidia bacterium]